LTAFKVAAAAKVPPACLKFSRQKRDGDDELKALFWASNIDHLEHNFDNLYDKSCKRYRKNERVFHS
jgi:hypothetical protein